MTCSHSLRARTALTLSLAALIVAPAAATTVLPAPAPAPTPAPSGSVAGPPDGLIAPPPTNPRPLPTPQIIVPAPTPAPTPTPRATQPPRLVPAPAPRQTNRAPAQTAPTPPPAAQATEPLLPEIQPPPLPGMSEDVAAPPVADTPAPAPLPTPADNVIPEWLPLAAIAAAVALPGGAWLWWRRRKRPLALPAPDPEVPAAPPVPKSVPPRPATVAAKPAAAPTPLGRRADLSVEFEALSAQSTLINLRIRYAVTVRNSGTLDAEPVTVRIGLFAGSHANPQGIAQWFTLEGEGPHHGVDRVHAGGDYRFEGELAAPLDALNPITVDGRVLAIPLVAVDARYNHGPGQAPIDGQAARAFVIGREPSREGAKLAPFRLDQGPTSFAPLGQRDTGISKVA